MSYLLGQRGDQDQEKREPRQAESGRSPPEERNPGGSNSQNTLDPLLLNSDYGTVLILGRSGTGKSTLIRNMLKENCKLNKRNSKKKTFVTINAKDAEYSKNPSLGKHVISDFGKLYSVPKKSVVIIEDIINMPSRDEKKLRHLLNYDSHHRGLRVFAVAHHVHRTSMLSMLPFFHYLIFTAAASNVALLKFSLSYFKVSTEQQQEWVKVFMTVKKNKYSFFVFDTTSLTLYYSAGISELSAGRQLKVIGSAGELENDTRSGPGVNDLQEKFDKFMVGQKNRHEASAVFSVLIKCLPLTNVREHDLTIAFVRKKTTV